MTGGKQSQLLAFALGLGWSLTKIALWLRWGVNLVRNCIGVTFGCKFSQRIAFGLHLGVKNWPKKSYIGVTVLLEGRE